MAQPRRIQACLDLQILLRNAVDLENILVMRVFEGLHLDENTTE